MGNKATNTNSFTIERCNPLPLGVSYDVSGVNFSVDSKGGNQCELIIFEKNKKKPYMTIAFPQEYRCGNVFSMRLLGFDYRNYEYGYRIYGSTAKQELFFIDPYVTKLTGLEKWGAKNSQSFLKGAFKELEVFDWEGDKPIDRPFHELIIYQLHVRGFTKHKSAKVEARGTFLGIAEKIPYLKELGINCIQLMPSYEFSEVLTVSSNMTQDMPQGAASVDFAVQKGSKKADKVRLNYWGYGDGYYFAPKASYAFHGIKGGQAAEMKGLVRTLHQNDIEILLEMHFAEGTQASLVLDCLRYWVLEYHVDGFKLSGDVPTVTINADPILGSTKLLVNPGNFKDNCPNLFGKKCIGEISADYRTILRKYLKSDVDMVGEMSHRIKRNPHSYAVVNLLTGHDSFTLMDMVSYDVKHNEGNGEGNRDGYEVNNSWNCGVEGKTRRIKVNQLRRKQMKNALVMLLVSQGTPLLLAGDEFGNSQYGNNNPYCQDNVITWLNWDQMKTYDEIFQFTKKMIAFRKSHPILHMEKELTGADLHSYGIPDISFHSTKTWYVDYSYYNRCLGVFYCGKYANTLKNNDNGYIYVAFNMFWENMEFSLPALPKPLNWRLAIHTGNPVGEEFLDEKAGMLDKQDAFLLEARSIAVFLGC